MTAPQPVPSNPSPPHPLYQLMELSRRARRAGSAAELRFMAVNDSHGLAPYRQAALWFSGLGVQALSGVVQIEANAPYALWLDKVCEHLQAHAQQPLLLQSHDLPADLAAEWGGWLPRHGLWLPMAAHRQPATPAGGLLIAREQAWQDAEVALLAEWMDAWHLAWRSQLRGAPQSLKLWRQRLRHIWTDAQARPWWRRTPLRWLAALALVLLIPVRLTILAPGELVPASPAVIRAPLDGVLDVFHVQPNQQVKAGQALFGFDEALIQSKLEVAGQALATAEAEYRQMIQLALSDGKSRAQLSVLTGKIEERRAEAVYLEEQLKRARVLAPQAGMALFDDPSEWLGKPVTVGERIMRIASPQDVEVEAWINVSDAIPVEDEAELTLFLSANPLSPVRARLRYFAHDAVARPDGSYAYRLRARIEGATEHRVGLKGTAKVHGDWVPLAYWVLRRPWAWLRAAAGW